MDSGSEPRVVEQKRTARQRALVRFNGVAFYGLAAASLIEAAAPLHAERLALALGGRDELVRWAHEVWGVRRGEIARSLRDYVVALWPEFDWEEAWREFEPAYRLRYGCQRAARGPAAELLGRCAGEAQAAVFYRAFSRAADDAELRGLAAEAAREHAAYFGEFRRAFERCSRRERPGPAGTVGILLEAARIARDREVALAFESLERCWNGPKSFVALEYREFLRRAGTLVRHHAALGPIERFLFRAWTRPPALSPASGLAPAATGAPAAVAQPHGPHERAA
jgi:hypothetical protein